MLTVTDFSLLYNMLDYFEFLIKCLIIKGKINVMPKLYLWNDLKLFYHQSNQEVIRIWEEFRKYIIQNDGYNNVEYFCFDSDILECWIKQLNYETEKIVSVGTRPAKMLKKRQDLDFIPITPCRIRSANGGSKCIVLSDKDKKVLKDVISSNLNGKIHIVEDAVVNGATIACLMEFIQKQGFKGTILVNTIFLNIEAKKIIEKEYSFDLKLKSYVMMEGKPIEESTLLCLYDLLFGEITEGKKYYERMDLLSVFLCNKNNQLLELINKCVKILRREK